jgi:hypothetical protein
MAKMSETDSIDIASRRLAFALDALEEAVDRRSEGDREQEALVTQVHALGADRARLASELDYAAARSRGLESANREVAQRLDQAIETIRGVLAHEE